MRSGQTIRMGLTWGGDPGPVALTASADIIPSSLVREHPTRELAAHPSLAYVTTEWITVTATSSAYDWVEGIGLSYLGTYQAQDDRIVEEHHDIVVPPRFHVIAAKGRALAWVTGVSPRPGHPMPVIAPVHDGHTLHLDVELVDTGDDADATAQRLSDALG